MKLDDPKLSGLISDTQSASALEYIANAWAEARDNGVSSEELSHAALFAALSSLVTQFGETAVIELVERLPKDIEKGEYTVRTSLQ